MVFLKSNFDGDVHAGGQIEFLQCVHGLGRWIEDVNEPLVRALLEGFLRFFVRVRRALNGETFDAGRQRDGPGDASAGAFDGVRDFASGLVYDAVVIGLEPDSDALCSHIKSDCIVMVVLNFPLQSFKADAKCSNIAPRCNNFLKEFWFTLEDQKPASTVDAPFGCDYFPSMSTVTEFKTAAEQLTAQDRWELYRWLGESQDVRRFRHEEFRREIALGIEQANRSEVAPL